MKDEQPKWLKKAKETFSFHRHKILDNDHHTVAMTAHLLRRSLGSVCEDLLIARWCRTHEKELEQYEYTYQALEFIREKKKEAESGELE